MTWYRKPKPRRAASLGQPLDRVDGRLKVTGGARYAAEFAVANVAHAVIVTSTIAKRKSQVDGHVGGGEGGRSY